MFIPFARSALAAFAVAVLAVASSPPPAQAQSETVQQSMVGAWVGTHSWSNGAVVEDIWDLAPDGSFTAGRPASANGRWLQSGDSIALIYDTGAQPLMVGTLRDGVVTGAGSTSSGYTAVWIMRRENDRR